MAKEEGVETAESAGSAQNGEAAKNTADVKDAEETSTKQAEPDAPNAFDQVKADDKDEGTTSKVKLDPRSTAQLG